LYFLRLFFGFHFVNQLGRINFDDFNSTKTYSKFLGYANSKLANVYFTKELARRLRESKSEIVTLGINPGSVATNIVGGAAMPWFLGKLYSVFGPYLLKTPFEGASSALFAALSDSVGREGEFRSGCVLFESKKDGSDPVPDANTQEARRIAKRLWDLSEQLTASTYPLSNG
jgi:NAD(P)-dependent dehydrogenase (short-subunit alcohol dehydrogenase family)